MVDIIGTILIVLIVSYLLGAIFNLIKLPKVIGQISAGLILGIEPFRSVLFGDSQLEVIAFLANLGIILLFYYVGLELNVKIIRKYAKPSLFISVIKTTVPLTLGYLVMHYGMGYTHLASILIGLILSTSAQSVSLTLLDDKHKIKSRIGTMLLSIGVVTDVIELVIVSVVLALFEIADQSLTFALFKILLFIIAIVLARLFIIPRTLRAFSKEGNSTSRFMGAMILLLAIATLAETLGIGALTGAVVAGIIIGQTILKDVRLPNWEEHDIARSIHIVGFGFFIPIFFVWIGLQTTPTFESAELSLILLVLTTAGILFSTILGGKISGLHLRESFTLGWGLLAKGDIGFVLSALALELAIITPSVFSALIIMSLLATLISPLMFEYSLN